jgi:transcriptional regulator with XRE-family HTH domain
MTDKAKNSPASEAWLRRMADAEDHCKSVSVGGLAHDLGLIRAGVSGGLRVLGRFIEFARRARGVSVEQFANKADIDLAELVALERDEDVVPTPRTVYQLAQALQVDTAKLMVLAGLADVADPELNRAALKFAARSEPTAQLSRAEQEAFDEFVKVLVERSDRT